jgi:hypothetical protein
MKIILTTLEGNMYVKIFYLTLRPIQKTLTSNNGLKIE